MGLFHLFTEFIFFFNNSLNPYYKLRVVNQIINSAISSINVIKYTRNYLIHTNSEQGSARRKKQVRGWLPRYVMIISSLFDQLGL
jgi:hypothetical protein